MRSARLLAALLIAPAGLLAQHPGPLGDSVKALRVEMRRIRDSMLSTDSTVHQVARRDGLAVLASRGLDAIALDAMNRLAAARARYFGPPPDGDPGFRLVVAVRPVVGADNRVRASAGKIVIAALPDTGPAPAVPLAADRSAVGDVVVDGYAELQYSAVPAVRAWLETPAPLSIDSVERTQVAHYAVATGLGRVERGCAAGDPGSCEIALLLVKPTPSGSGAIYTPYLRTQFLLGALIAGGAGSWQRLRSAIDAGKPIGTAIAAAASMPEDSLVRRWRGSLMGTGSVGGPLDPSRIVTGLAWCCAALLVAIGGARWA